MVERASSSGAPAAATGEMQTTARVSVMDRLGPMPAQKRGRERSVEGGGSSSRRGRKFSKNGAQEAKSPQGGKTARVPVHERLGPMHQPQAFKKNELFQKRNRQQVWRHQGVEEVLRPQVYTREKPEQISSPASASAAEEVENVSNPPSSVKPFVKPASVVKPFNAEQHRQAWTWTRPKADASAGAMEVDE